MGLHLSVARAREVAPRAVATRHNGEETTWGEFEDRVAFGLKVGDRLASGGENVHSAEVENALQSHPDVAAEAVIGLPSERWGETVDAVVVARRPVTAAELISRVRTHIAGYKCPKSVTFLDSLPLSAVGKIRKAALCASLMSPSTEATNA